jgi:hypothetical protein
VALAQALRTFIVKQVTSVTGTGHSVVSDIQLDDGYNAEMWAAMFADITVDASVLGLAMRFDALNIKTTGCFETWDGRPHDY